MALGLLLGAAALLLTVYNVMDDYQAGQNANVALELVSDLIPESIPSLEKQMESISSFSELEIPNYILDPDREMTVKMLDGQAYIGVIEIPSLSLKLPVISEWSDSKLKIAPCRYLGSVYTNDLIIAGHSYKNHFRYIRKMNLGDEVIFTDMEGNQFMYEVAGMEVIEGTDTAKMEEGEWDLTMFTCTPSGSSRYTVRCTRTDDDSSWRNY